MANLFETIRDSITPELLDGIGSYVGEDPSTIRTAADQGIASLLAGMLSAGRPGGPGLLDRALDLLRGQDLGSLLHDLPGLLGGPRSGTPDIIPEPLERILSLGQSLVGLLFGGNLNKVGDQIARDSGVQSSSVAPMLALLAPLVMRGLGLVTGGHPTAFGVWEVLEKGRDSFIRKAPQGLPFMLGLGGVDSPVRGDSKHSLAPPGEESQWAPWWLIPTLGALVVGGLALAFLLPRDVPPKATDQPTPALVDDGQTINHDVARPVSPAEPMDAGPASTEPPADLSAFLASYDRSQLPRSFALGGLVFEGETANLGPTANTYIDQLARPIAAIEGARVNLIGHTADGQDSEPARLLALDRANAVKAALVKAGLSADRIATEAATAGMPGVVEMQFLP